MVDIQILNREFKNKKLEVSETLVCWLIASKENDTEVFNQLKELINSI